MSLVRGINLREYLHSQHETVMPQAVNTVIWKKGTAESLLTTLPLLIRSEIVFRHFVGSASYTGFGGCMFNYSVKWWPGQVYIFNCSAVLTSHVILMQVFSISFLV